MVTLKLKLDNDFVLLRIFDEKNECLAEVSGKVLDNREILGEIGKAYGFSFKGLRDLIFCLENPKSIVEGIIKGYELTRDR